MIYIATEAGRYESDVIGTNSYESIEIEIKSSWSDFMADFKNKKKHEQFKSEAHTDYAPNCFYFCINGDQKLQNKVLAYLKANYPKYGVLIPTNDTYRILKSAKRLHKYLPHKNQVNMILRRMGSDICNKYRDINLLRKSKKEEGE